VVQALERDNKNVLVGGIRQQNEELMEQRVVFGIINVETREWIQNVQQMVQRLAEQLVELRKVEQLGAQSRVKPPSQKFKRLYGVFPKALDLTKPLLIWKVLHGISERQKRLNTQQHHAQSNILTLALGYQVVRLNKVLD